MASLSAGVGGVANEWTATREDMSRRQEVQMAKEQHITVLEDNQMYAMFVIRWIFQTFPALQMSSEVLQQAVNILLQYVGNMSESTQVRYPSKSWEMSMKFAADMRQSKHPCLVGATCVNIAYKMELNNGLYSPSYMCR